MLKSPTVGVALVFGILLGFSFLQGAPAELTTTDFGLSAKRKSLSQLEKELLSDRNVTIGAVITYLDKAKIYSPAAKKIKAALNMRANNLSLAMGKSKNKITNTSVEAQRTLSAVIDLRSELVPLLVAINRTDQKTEAYQKLQLTISTALARYLPVIAPNSAFPQQIDPEQKRWDGIFAAFLAQDNKLFEAYLKVTREMAETPEVKE